MFSQIIVFGAILLIASLVFSTFSSERLREASAGLLRVALIAILIGLIGSVSQ